MKIRKQIPASVLPTVVIVSVIMMIVILGLLSLWDTDLLYLSRYEYTRKQMSHIESFYTLYCAHPQVVEAIGEDSLFQLYADREDSRLRITVNRWGLYEVVNVSSLCGRVTSCRIMGAGGEDETALWYSDHGAAITLTGKTEVIGQAALPALGVIYGQMQSEFFSGEEIPAGRIAHSGNTLPAIDGNHTTAIDALFSVPAQGMISEGMALQKALGEGEPMVLAVENGWLRNCAAEGEIIITGNRIRVDSSCRLTNAILVADFIEISDGTRGVFQAFARDSLKVGKDVRLDFPSGIYSRNRITLDDHAVINGYVINDFEGERDPTIANTVKSRTSRIRGLFFARGTTQVQGITTGNSFIEEATFFTERGYYRNLIHDAAFIHHPGIAYPLWMDSHNKRRTAGRVY
ncbi:MAG: hypothetical protein LUF87_07930 [Alistipes sp.]|nr:hypothetical protein [Alistipes sp.]